MKLITCPECKKEKEHHAKGYCRNCYNRLRMRKIYEKAKEVKDE